MQKQLRIAYILPSLANKGPVLVVKDIVSYLRAYAQIDVFYFDPIVETSFDCPVRQINFNKPIDFAAYDIVHSHMLRPDAYLRRYHRQVTGKSVSTLHNYVEQDLLYQYNKLTSIVFSRVWRLLLRKHALLVALSKHMQVYYEQLYRFRNITYIYNGRDIQSSGAAAPDILFEDKEQIRAFKKGHLLIGVAALLTHRKGLDQLLQLLQLEKGYRLLIIGDGQAKEALLAKAKELQVEQQCLFLGYRKDAFRYYAFFDVYAMPSRSEGFPLALIEAAAYGLPVICSDLPVFREILTGNEVVFFELENIKDLQEKLKLLISDKQAYAQNLLQKYRKSFSANIMAENYYKAYQKLLNI